MKDVKEDDLEFFFHSSQGVIGTSGKAPSTPKVSEIQGLKVKNNTRKLLQSVYVSEISRYY